MRTKKIHWHKFPDDQKHGDVWRNKIPHQKWDVTEHTRICHKHFLPTDYESERNDKQSRRKSKKGDFVLWILKSAAVPSVWPGLPSHLTKPLLNPRRSTLASAEAREHNVEAIEVRREKAHLSQDSFSSLDELKIKIAGIDDWKIEMF